MVALQWGYAAEGRSNTFYIDSLTDKQRHEASVRYHRCLIPVRSIVHNNTEFAREESQTLFVAGITATGSDLDDIRVIALTTKTNNDVILPYSEEQFICVNSQSFIVDRWLKPSETTSDAYSIIDDAITFSKSSLKLKVISTLERKIERV